MLDGIADCRQTNAAVGRCQTVRLTDEVGLIAVVASASGLSHPLDCHVYVLDGGDELP